MVCLCKICGKETEKKPYYYKKFNGNVYCSQACFVVKQRLRFPRLENTCLKCNKSFKAYPSDATYNRGKLCSKTCKDRWQKEDNHWRWKNASSEAERLRHTPAYKNWRTSVFIRDNKKCIWCDSTKQIEADHIKPRYLFPELTLDIGNGRTLCQDCHKKTPSYMNGFMKREDFL